MADTAPSAPRPAKPPRPRWFGDLLTIAVVALLFAGVYLLPPDTSLSEMQKSGVLSACVPTSYPPLITGNPDMPGVDAELLQLVADRLGVRLRLNTIPAMGQDFNPRNWRVTRAQCQVLAGGVVLSQLTRSFLDSTPPHLETGWALITTDGSRELSGKRVGVFSGLSGLDRIGLSSYLRAAGAQIAVQQSAQALQSGLASGELQAGVTESLLARQIAFDLSGAEVSWLPLERLPLGFGLWKGDLTLKRELVAIMDQLEAEGVFQQLLEKYEIAPISEAPAP